MNQTNDNATNVRPMRIGRALHMDLSRASDTDLQRAFQVLDDYDNAGKASAYTQAKFDDRIDDIFAEMDRRAGFEPIFVTRLPLEHYFPGTLEAAGDDDDEREPDGAPIGEDADGLTPAEREAGRENAPDADTFAQSGLVPGLTSAI
jgi:hypothetical protein